MSCTGAPCPSGTFQMLYEGGYGHCASLSRADDQPGPVWCPRKPLEWVGGAISTRFGSPPERSSEPTGSHRSPCRLVRARMRFGGHRETNVEL